MNTARSVRIKMQMMDRLQDLESKARIFGMPSHEITKEFQKLKENLPKGTPSWVIWYLNGAFDQITKGYYKHDLEFCYMVDGIRYSTHKTSEMYYEKHGITPQILSQTKESMGHYWKHNGRPYFVD